MSGGTASYTARRRRGRDSDVARNFLAAVQAGAAPSVGERPLTPSKAAAAASWHSNNNSNSRPTTPTTPTTTTHTTTTPSGVYSPSLWSSGHRSSSRKSHQSGKTEPTLDTQESSLTPTTYEVEDWQQQQSLHTPNSLQRTSEFSSKSRSYEYQQQQQQPRPHLTPTRQFVRDKQARSGGPLFPATSPRALEDSCLVTTPTKQRRWPVPGAANHNDQPLPEIQATTSYLTTPSPALSQQPQQLFRDDVRTTTSSITTHSTHTTTHGRRLDAHVKPREPRRAESSQEEEWESVSTNEVGYHTNSSRGSGAVQLTNRQTLGESIDQGIDMLLGGSVFACNTPGRRPQQRHQQRQQQQSSPHSSRQNSASRSPHQSPHRLQKAMSTVSGASTEVATNRAVDMALRRVQEIEHSRGTQQALYEARAALERLRLPTTTAPRSSPTHRIAFGDHHAATPPHHLSEGQSLLSDSTADDDGRSRASSIPTGTGNGRLDQKVHRTAQQLQQQQQEQHYQGYDGEQSLPCESLPSSIGVEVDSRGVTKSNPALKAVFEQHTLDALRRQAPPPPPAPTNTTSLRVLDPSSFLDPSLAAIYHPPPPPPPKRHFEVRKYSMKTGQTTMVKPVTPLPTPVSPAHSLENSANPDPIVCHGSYVSTVGGDDNSTAVPPTVVHSADLMMATSTSQDESCPPSVGLSPASHRSVAMAPDSVVSPLSHESPAVIRRTFHRSISESRSRFGKQSSTVDPDENDEVARITRGGAPLISPLTHAEVTPTMREPTSSTGQASPAPPKRQLSKRWPPVATAGGDRTMPPGDYDENDEIARITGGMGRTPPLTPNHRASPANVLRRRGGVDRDSPHQPTPSAKPPVRGGRISALRERLFNKRQKDRPLDSFVVRRASGETFGSPAIDDTSIDMQSIRSAFESAHGSVDKFAAAAAAEDYYYDDDDDTASVKSLKEMYETGTPKEEESEVSKFRAMFEAKGRPTPKPFEGGTSELQEVFSKFQRHSKPAAKFKSLRQAERGNLVKPDVQEAEKEEANDDADIAPKPAASKQTLSVADRIKAFGGQSGTDKAATPSRVLATGISTPNRVGTGSSGVAARWLKGDTPQRIALRSDIVKGDEKKRSNGSLEQQHGTPKSVATTHVRTTPVSGRAKLVPGASRVLSKWQGLGAQKDTHIQEETAKPLVLPEGGGKTGTRPSQWMQKPAPQTHRPRTPNSAPRDAGALPFQSSNPIPRASPPLFQKPRASPTTLEESRIGLHTSPVPFRQQYAPPRAQPRVVEVSADESHIEQELAAITSTVALENKDISADYSERKLEWFQRASTEAKEMQSREIRRTASPLTPSRVKDRIRLFTESNSTMAGVRKPVPTPVNFSADLMKQKTPPTTPERRMIFSRVTRDPLVRDAVSEEKHRQSRESGAHEFSNPQAHGSEHTSQPPTGKHQANHASIVHRVEQEPASLKAPYGKALARGITPPARPPAPIGVPTTSYSIENKMNDTYDQEDTIQTLDGTSARQSAGQDIYRTSSASGSDFSDGVTLDMSIAEVSNLTVPTALISRHGERSVATVEEEDYSEESSKVLADVETKPSEASSSQPSEALVPLINKTLRQRSDDRSMGDSFFEGRVLAAKSWGKTSGWDSSHRNAAKELKKSEEAKDDSGAGWDAARIEETFPVTPSNAGDIFEFESEWSPFSGEQPGDDLFMPAEEKKTEDLISRSTTPTRSNTARQAMDDLNRKYLLRSEHTEPQAFAWQDDSVSPRPSRASLAWQRNDIASGLGDLPAPSSSFDAENPPAIRTISSFESVERLSRSHLAHHTVNRVSDGVDIVLPPRTGDRDVRVLYDPPTIHHVQQYPEMENKGSSFFGRTHPQRSDPTWEKPSHPSFDPTLPDPLAMPIPVPPQAASWKPPSSGRSNPMTASMQRYGAQHAALLARLKALKEARLRRANAIYARTTSVFPRQVEFDDYSLSTKSSTQFGGSHFKESLKVD